MIVLQASTHCVNSLFAVKKTFIRIMKMNMVKCISCKSRIAKLRSIKNRNLVDIQGMPLFGLLYIYSWQCCILTYICFFCCTTDTRTSLIMRTHLLKKFYIAIIDAKEIAVTKIVISNSESLVFENTGKISI